MYYASYIFINGHGIILVVVFLNPEDRSSNLIGSRTFQNLFFEGIKARYEGNCHCLIDGKLHLKEVYFTIILPFCVIEINQRVDGRYKIINQ